MASAREIKKLHGYIAMCKGLAASPRMVAFMEQLGDLLGYEVSAVLEVPLILRYSGKATVTLDGDTLLGSLREARSNLYVCRLTTQGGLCCVNEKAKRCPRSRKRPCEHLCTLLTKLVYEERMTPEVALGWVKAARLSPSKMEEKGELMALLLSVTQPEDVDWRPGESLPEDHYAK